MGRIRLRVFLLSADDAPASKSNSGFRVVFFTSDAFLTVFPLHSSVVCFVLAFIYLFRRSFSSSGLSP